MTHISSYSFSKGLDSFVIFLQFFLAGAFSHICEAFDRVDTDGISEILEG
jgi:hypothetical protein